MNLVWSLKQRDKHMIQVSLGTLVIPNALFPDKQFGWALFSLRQIPLTAVLRICHRHLGPDRHELHIHGPPRD